MIFKYFKNNIYKYLPLMIFSFVFALLFLYSYSIISANNYLSDEIKNTVDSEIELSGRMFSLSQSDDFIYSNNDDVKDELNNIINLLDENDATYDLMCFVKLPDSNLTCDKEAELILFKTVCKLNFKVFSSS